METPQPASRSFPSVESNVSVKVYTPPGVFLTQGSNHVSMSPALAGGFFTTVLRGLHQTMYKTMFGGVLSPIVSQKKVVIYFFFKGSRANKIS